MNADHFFEIGYSHKVCEDYAASSDTSCWTNDRKGFALVSDGCSVTLDSKGKPFNAHTDFGSRLLSRATADVLAENWNDQLWIHRTILAKAQVYTRALGFPIQTLSATLLTIQDTQESFTTTVAGDGFYGARIRGTNNWEVTEISYNQELDPEKPGIPYYLRYELSASDRQAFFQAKQVRTVTSHVFQLEPYEVSLPCSQYEEILPQGICLHKRVLPKDKYDVVFISSDGLKSFTLKELGKNPQSVDSFVVLKEILCLQNLKGEFVQRRLKRAMKDLGALNITHYDDFSIAMMVAD